jgi:carbamoyl-phosphate synthase large subunit
MRELNILITAASRRVALIQAFVDGLKNLGLKGSVVTTDMNTMSPGLYFSHRHYLVPMTTDPRYISIIRSICFKERIHLLIPTIDDELPVFGHHADAFLAAGVRVAVSGSRTGEICNDKYLTADFLSGKGIAIAKTWLPDELRLDQLQYPLFLKPRQGRGSVGAHRIADQEELEFYLRHVADPVVQEYLGGREFTIDVLADFSGKIISAVPRERLVIRSGVTDQGRTSNDPLLVNTGVRVAEALEIRGPANIQVKYLDGRVTVFEVNPRFSGGIPLTIAAGANFPEWLMEMRCGRRVKPCLGRFSDGMMMACYESAIFYPAQPAAENAPEAERVGTVQ